MHAVLVVLLVVSCSPAGVRCSLLLVVLQQQACRNPTRRMLQEGGQRTRACVCARQS